MFNYERAFSRNIGWVTPEEQQILRHRRIAIAGLGGVGGSHLITLTRLGIGKFNISDFDSFGIENFNRQFGASMSTLEQPKIEVLDAQAKDINPELDIQRFEEGVNENNVDAFLKDVDLYVDSLDFFSVKARRLLFSKCTEKGIPAITAAPLGMGCAYLGFLPGKMSFEEYFQLEGQNETEQLIRFLVGLAPARLQNQYLIYPQAVDIPNRKGPSTPLAVELCAGIAGTEALKILLHRGTPVAAPWGLQFDAYRNKVSKTFRPGGNSNPLQQLSLVFGRRKFGKAPQRTVEQEYQPQNKIETILATARWAPSGDNGQPWRFSVIDESRFLIKVDLDAGNPYEYNKGEPTLLSCGMLLESLSIAASQIGYRLNYEAISAADQLTINCNIEPDQNLDADELYAFIKVRSVNRLPYRRNKLSEQSVAALSQTLHPSLELTWHNSLNERWQMTKLNALATDIRLRLKSCYEVHRKIVDWTPANSPSGVPSQALGLDSITLIIMKWAMARWERINFMNTYLGATATARLQMDLLPGLRCAAHFSIYCNEGADKSVENLLAMGASLQRFWLTATKLGIAMQPGLAPLCFANRANSPEVFREDQKSLEKAKSLKEKLQNRLNHSTEDILFLGRIGYPNSQPVRRSVRLDLSKLLKN